MDRYGVELDQFFEHIIIADTQVLEEDTLDESLPDSLSGLVLKYDLYKRIASKKGTTGFMFDGAHNAGNDAVANPKALLCIIADNISVSQTHKYLSRIYWTRVCQIAFRRSTSLIKSQRRRKILQQRQKGTHYDLVLLSFCSLLLPWDGISGHSVKSRRMLMISEGKISRMK